MSFLAKSCRYKKILTHIESWIYYTWIQVQTRILPVDGDIIFDTIDDPDEKSVIFPGVDSWTWEFSIYSNDGFGWTQTSSVLHNHLHNVGILKLLKESLIIGTWNICLSELSGLLKLLFLSGKRSCILRYGCIFHLLITILTSYHNLLAI